MTGTETGKTTGRAEMPHEFISTFGYEGSLSDEQLRKLGANCSNRMEGPEEGQTTFIFSKWAPTDHHHLVIIADREKMTWKSIRKPHCHCSRGAMECECTEHACRHCGKRLPCLTSVCDSEFCTDTDCRLCSHEREECGYEECLEAIRTEVREELARGSSIACAHVGAVATVLAPGVGDAPIFPATVRILDALLGGSHDWEEAQRTDGSSLRWECEDGSVLMNDPNWSGWLEYEEA